MSVTNLIGIGHYFLIQEWLGDDQRTNSKRHMFKGNWTTSSNFIYCSTLNSEPHLEDLCIRLRNQ